MGQSDAEIGRFERGLQHEHNHLTGGHEREGESNGAHAGELVEASAREEQRDIEGEAERSAEEPRSVASSQVEAGQSDRIGTRERKPGEEEANKAQAAQQQAEATTGAEEEEIEAAIFRRLGGFLSEGLRGGRQRGEGDKANVAVRTAFGFVVAVELATKGTRQKRHDPVRIADSEATGAGRRLLVLSRLPRGLARCLLTAVPELEIFGLAPDSPHLAEALTHPSYAHEVPGTRDNQRLEFLGDSVLNFVTSRALFERFPDANEGELTRRRAQIVSTEALALFARNHEIGGGLRFGRGAAQAGLTDSDNVLADAVEALLAATFLDQGLAAAESVGLRIVDFALEHPDARFEHDPKSELQMRAQARGKKAPTYEVLSQVGPQHDCVFEVSVRLDGQEVGRGTGRSKKAAERSAALDALARERALEQEEKS